MIIIIAENKFVFCKLLNSRLDTSPNRICVLKTLSQEFMFYQSLSLNTKLNELICIYFFINLLDKAIIYDQVLEIYKFKSIYSIIKKYTKVYF